MGCFTKMIRPYGRASATDSGPEARPLTHFAAADTSTARAYSADGLPGHHSGSCLSPRTPLEQEGVADLSDELLDQLGRA